jgi:diadenylate cyclase
MRDILSSLRAKDMIDIAVVAVLMYSLLFWFRRTRAAFVLIGMMIIGVLYLLARQFALNLTTAILQAFFAVILIAVLIIFQEEIRRFFEQIASRSLVRGPDPRKAVLTMKDETEILVRVVTDLARQRRGAIIVLRGRTPLDRHLTGGIRLDGFLSESILKSIFDPNSPGHDGAVIVQGNRLIQFGCRLPLSGNTTLTEHVGTRHTAALGLSELSDALVLVVSEERGTISTARSGDLRLVAEPNELRQIVGDFLRGVGPAEHRGVITKLLTQNYVEKLSAVGLALLLWFLLVHEAALEYRSIRVPVTVILEPTGQTIGAVYPAAVKVTISGPRRAFYFFENSDVTLSLPLTERLDTAIEKSLMPSDFSLPPGLTITDIVPAEITISSNDSHQQ